MVAVAAVIKFRRLQTQVVAAAVVVVASVGMTASVSLEIHPPTASVGLVAHVLRLDRYASPYGK